MKTITFEEAQRKYDNQLPTPWPEKEIEMPEDYGDEPVVVGKQIKPREKRK